MNMSKLLDSFELPTSEEIFTRLRRGESLVFFDHPFELELIKYLSLLDV